MLEVGDAQHFDAESLRMATGSPERRLRIGLRIIAVVALVAGLGACRYLNGPGDAEFWESDITAYEESDRTRRPDTGAILFTGSSSIRMWDSLEADMAPWYVLNRGFGGAHLAHVNTFMSRIVLPYKPSAIVLYAGDNDIAAGKSAEQVSADFQRFASLVRYSGSRAPVFYVAIKPSRLRFALWPEMAEANRKIAELVEPDPAVHFIDVASPMLALAPPGEPPPPELFLSDGLHLSEEGYALWTRIVREEIQRVLRRLRSHEPPR